VGRAAERGHGKEEEGDGRARTQKEADRSSPALEPLFSGRQSFLCHAISLLVIGKKINNKEGRKSILLEQMAVLSSEPDTGQSHIRSIRTPEVTPSTVFFHITKEVSIS
jgi:hypothetical protein